MFNRFRNRCESFTQYTSFEIFPGISESSKICSEPDLQILFTVDIFSGDKKSLTPDKISKVVSSAVSVSGCSH